MAEQLAELNKGDTVEYDTGAQDLYYNTTKVGYYRRVGHVVTISVRYTGSGTVNLTTQLPADCRPNETIQFIIMTGNAGNQATYAQIYATNGTINLTNVSAVGAFVVTYVV